MSHRAMRKRCGHDLRRRRRSGLGITVSLASLYVVLLILITRRREYKLTKLLEQLSVELAMLSERKMAKVIQLLEESRRDNPLVHDRIDQEAEAMAQPADPRLVLEAISEAPRPGRNESKI